MRPLPTALYGEARRREDEMGRYGEAWDDRPRRSAGRRAGVVRRGRWWARDHRSCPRGDGGRPRCRGPAARRRRERRRPDRLRVRPVLRLARPGRRAAHRRRPAPASDRPAEHPGEIAAAEPDSAVAWAALEEEAKAMVSALYGVPNDRRIVEAAREDVIAYMWNRLVGSSWPSTTACRSRHTSRPGSTISPASCSASASKMPTPRSPSTTAGRPTRATSSRRTGTASTPTAPSAPVPAAAPAASALRRAVHRVRRRNRQQPGVRRRRRGCHLEQGRAGRNARRHRRCRRADGGHRGQHRRRHCVDDGNLLQALPACPQGGDRDLQVGRRRRHRRAFRRHRHRGRCDRGRNVARDRDPGDAAEAAAKAGDRANDHS